jgi:hypothetical protein
MQLRNVHACVYLQQTVLITERSYAPGNLSSLLHLSCNKQVLYGWAAAVA